MFGKALRVVLPVAAVVMAFSLPATAQETTATEDTAMEDVAPLGKADASGAEETRILRQAENQSEPSGDLAGKTADARENNDGFVDLVVIEAANCDVNPNSAIVFQDEPGGTLGVAVNLANAVISADETSVTVEGTDPNTDDEPIDFVAREPLEGDEYTVESSSGIICEEDGGEPGDGGTGGDAPDGDAPGGTPGGTDDGLLPEEPRDEEAGPLAGGTAIGLDVLVPGDFECGPEDDPDAFVCIDRVVIETENCELTATGDGLTITLQDPAGPVRIRDGDNVDITMEDDGTIVADGREEIRGEPNPNRAITPIPVDPENFTPDDQPNDTFPIISSTGIGGEGCRPLVAAEETTTDDDVANDDAANDAGETTTPEGVIVSTIPDKTLANTGGQVPGGPSPLFPVSGIMFGAAMLAFAVLRR